MTGQGGDLEFQFAVSNEEKAKDAEMSVSYVGRAFCNSL